MEHGSALFVGVSGGLVLGLDGEVQETERPLYAYTDDHSGAPPERYGWKELGFEERYPVYGFSLERRGRAVTWLLDATRGNTRVAGTADRDYYIGVGRVEYGGRAYEHLFIPEGVSYRGDITAYTLAASARVTPVSYRGTRGGGFVPWIHLGLFGFAGDYVIDAGESHGVVRYERPERDYVVGGRGSGVAGMAMPELGLGMDLEWATGAATRLSLRGFAARMRLRASSQWFGTGARNEKRVDVEYTSYGGKIQWEWDMNRRLAFFVGGEFLYRTAAAEVSAVDRPAEEVIARREKFNKSVRYEMKSALAYFGFRF